MKIVYNDNSYLMLKLNKLKLQQFYLKCQKDKLIGIDTEFYRVSSYYPKLCLIQISNNSESIIIDPISEKLDNKFIEKLLFNKSILKVFFAANQDIEIFFKMYNKIPSPICDIQICASLLEKNHSLSYSSVCKKFLAIHVKKDQQFVDWRKRPLSFEKIKYAFNDVKYLLPLYYKLDQKINLSEKSLLIKKLHEKLINPLTYSNKPMQAWKKLRFLPDLKENLEKLKNICEIREKIAIKENVPVKKIIKNYEIKEFFKKNSSYKKKKKIIKKLKKFELKQFLEELL